MRRSAAYRVGYVLGELGGVLVVVTAIAAAVTGLAALAFTAWAVVAGWHEKSRGRESA